MEFDNASNRLIIDYELTSSSIDYVVRCVGMKMSQSLKDRLIVAKVVKDEIRTVGGYDEDSGENTFLAFVALVNLHLGDYLLLDKKYAFMYEKTHKVKNFIFELYDLSEKKIYSFDTNCDLNDGYFVDKNNFILKVNKAIDISDFSGAEVLVLSMASDAIFDADGKMIG